MTRAPLLPAAAPPATFDRCPQCGGEPTHHWASAEIWCSRCRAHFRRIAAGIEMLPAGWPTDWQPFAGGEHAR